MKQSQKIMLRALRAAMFGKKVSFPEDTDWNDVIKEAKEQTVLGLISPVIPEKYISGEESISHIRANYIRLLYEQDKLLRLLDENNIPCVILKGCAAAAYYPKPFLREMGDIDVLVPRDRIEDAMKVVENEGYSVEGGIDKEGNIIVSERHVEYVKNGVVVELHHRFCQKGFDFDDVLEEAINRREYIEMSGYRIPVLPEMENGLVLMGHILPHLWNNKLGIRQILDWAMYINNIKNMDKWRAEFIPAVEKAGLDKLAYVVTAMCERRLGLKTASLPYDSDDIKLGDKLLKKIIESGNFGRKISLTSSEKNIQSAIYGMKTMGALRYLRNYGLKHWKLCKKYPFLTHFAWIYGLLRFVRKGIRAVFSIKNIRGIKKQISAGEKRFDFWSKVGIESIH